MRRLRSSRRVSFALAVLASVLLSAPAARAASCGSAVIAGTSCTLTGTVTLSGGTLTLTSPSSLTWSGTLTGSAQSIVDTVATDQQLTVTDATGSAAGWHITTAATTFTTGTNSLPDSGTFVFTGSTTSVNSTSAPTATCVTSCTLPTDNTTYPVAITTAGSSPTPVTTYDTSAGTGLAAIIIGGSTQSNPVGWWVNIPATAVAGTYTSTITMEIISGP